VQAALTQMLRTCDTEGFDLLAYCFMPDHVHLVVEGTTPIADLRRLVCLMKQRSAYVFECNSRYGSCGRRGITSASCGTMNRRWS
jgi:REP element-mobilizing transposase RayT